MAIYTVHVPDDAPDHVTRADRTHVIREGFNIWALVFGWVFLLWHRLWVAAAAFLALTVVIGALCWALHVPVATSVSLAILIHVFLGVEGNDLRRWSLDRRGFRLTDVVSGATIEDAEVSYFHRAAPARAIIRTASSPARDTTPAVIGMFPEGGAS